MDEFTSDSLLQAYATGERDFQKITAIAVNLFEADLRQINLSNSCLNSIYMPYGNFSLAQLQRISLVEAQLADSTLYGVDLTQANLTNANLSRTDLRNANLTGAVLSGANLSGANLSGANLSGANLEGCNLTGAMLQKAILQDTNLRRCNLFRAVGAELQGGYCDVGTILPSGHYYEG
jgi:uncharacterized protein YjbI with pentapeptide repeats